MLLGGRDKRRALFQAAAIGHIVLGAALVISEDVLENDEKPGAQIRPWLPRANVCDSPGEALLNSGRLNNQHRASCSAQSAAGVGFPPSWRLSFRDDLVASTHLRPVQTAIHIKGLLPKSKR